MMTDTEYTDSVIIAEFMKRYATKRRVREWIELNSEIMKHLHQEVQLLEQLKEVDEKLKQLEADRAVLIATIGNEMGL